MERQIKRARDMIARATTVAAFSGAGISAESGIATFRDSETHALWKRFDPLKLASPEGFIEDPETVIDWYNWRREQLSEVSPNGGHLAFARYPDLVQITQNVDDLLERAGVNSDHIYHLHGTITKDRCHSRCGYEETVDLATAPGLRHCPHCNAFMRPALVWFGEPLPEAVWHKAEVLCSRINCLLVVGTSASVYPAAGLIEIAKSSGAHIIIINTQSSGVSDLADVEIIGRSGELLPLLLEGLSLSSY